MAAPLPTRLALGYIPGLVCPCADAANAAAPWFAVETGGGPRACGSSSSGGGLHACCCSTRASAEAAPLATGAAEAVTDAGLNPIAASFLPPIPALEALWSSYVQVRSGLPSACM